MISGMKWVIALFVVPVAASAQIAGDYRPASFGLFAELVQNDASVKVYAINPNTGGATQLWQGQVGDETNAYVLNNFVFFSACTTAEGCELWETDGTPGAPNF
jgi:hypothetical protein